MQGRPVNRLEHSWTKPVGYGQELTDFSPPSRWQDAAKNWESNAENFIVDHPRLALAAAAAVGLVLGWIVKRK
jgi:ElaB/YqjD/DUF883 family membrane-anchored ribosome-binding protein